MKAHLKEEVVFFNILEEIYNLNHKKWEKQIMLTLLTHQEVPYTKIKEQLPEIPDLLAYRCIREMITEGMILRNSKAGQTYYTFTQEGRALAPILQEMIK